jgi:two-component system OmpR family response regulator
MSTAVCQKTIIVCDDCDDILGMLYSLLGRAGHRVETVHGYDELQQILKRVQPDLFVLDILMPEYDGFWIAEELLSQGYTTPIMFITAYDSPALRLNAPVIGAVEYLMKPIDPDILLQKVEKAFRCKPSETNWNLKITGPRRFEDDPAAVSPMPPGDRLPPMQ